MSTTQKINNLAAFVSRTAPSPAFVNNSTLQTTGYDAQVESVNLVTQEVEVRSGKGSGNAITKWIKIANAVTAGPFGAAVPRKGDYVRVSFIDGIPVANSISPQSTDVPGKIVESIRASYEGSKVQKFKVRKAYYDVKTTKEHNEALIPNNYKPGKLIGRSPITRRAMVAEGDSVLYEGDQGSKIVGMNDGAVAMIGGPQCHTTWMKRDDYMLEIARSRGFYHHGGYEKWAINGNKPQHISESFDIPAANVRAGEAYYSLKTVVNGSGAFYKAMLLSGNRGGIPGREVPKKAWEIDYVGAEGPKAGTATYLPMLALVQTAINFAQYANDYLNIKFDVTQLPLEQSQTFPIALVQAKTTGQMQLVQYDKEGQASTVIDMAADGKIQVTNKNDISVVTTGNAKILAGKELTIEAAKKTTLKTKELHIKAETFKLETKDIAASAENMMTLIGKVGVAIASTKDKAGFIILQAKKLIDLKAPELPFLNKVIQAAKDAAKAAATAAVQGVTRTVSAVQSKLDTVVRRNKLK